MADLETKIYHRLPGSGYRRIVPGWAIVLLFFVIGIFALLLRGRQVRLWRGAEHLLVVEWDGYREYYKRFRYADIQGIVVRQDREWIEMAVASGLVMLLLLGLAVVVGEAVMGGILAGLAAIFLVFLIATLAAGPTCQCRLTTAVQSEDLVSLRRVKTARKVLDQLRPLILAAQAGLVVPSLQPLPQPSVEQEVLPAEPGGA